jgi:hypothetical protein
MGSEMWCLLLAWFDDTAGSQHGGDEDMMRKICMLICNLCPGLIDNQIEQGESGCCEIILSWWMMHDVKNDAVFVVCCHALSVMLSQTKEVNASKISKAENFAYYAYILSRRIFAIPKFVGQYVLQSLSVLE